jgi:hypothetical protein
LGPDDQHEYIKQRDDLISALRYAIMVRRQGKALPECEGVGNGNMFYGAQRSQHRQPRYARGTANHPDGGFDPFTVE